MGVTPVLMPGGDEAVVSVWIVPIKSDTPYLVTAYIE